MRTAPFFDGKIRVLVGINERLRVGLIGRVVILPKVRVLQRLRCRNALVWIHLEHFLQEIDRYITGFHSIMKLYISKANSKNTEIPTGFAPAKNWEKSCRLISGKLAM